MKRTLMKIATTLLIIILVSNISYKSYAQDNVLNFQTDTIKTSIGDVRISFLGHASLLIQLDTLDMYVDPWSRYIDFEKMPKADLILLTHHHPKHFDRKAISKLFQNDVRVMGSQKCHDELNYINILNNEGWSYFNNMKIESCHAYNIKLRDDNYTHYHIKWDGNGYILNFGDTRIYIAGDTELIPEMSFTKNITIAFFPLESTTMNPSEFLKTLEIIKPKIAYPYEYEPYTENELKEIFKNYKGETEIRIRNFYPEISYSQYGSYKLINGN